MTCSFICPECGAKLRARLPHEITAVRCACGHTFLAQHPDVGAGLFPKSPKTPKSASKAPAAAPKLTLELLRAADDATSNAVIAVFKDDKTFRSFAKAEMNDILARDAEDDAKLAKGIRMAVAKGVLPPDPPVEQLRQIDVLGLSADAVADEIVCALGGATKKGCVLVLQGLSGTGKGTTVAKLQQKLPRAAAWSNGNVFRALTLLAVTHCEVQRIPFSQAALTPALLSRLMRCLTFGKSSKTGAFDIRILGLGFDTYVSELANTTLKEPKVGRNIPTVAEMTQGEVVRFAAAAAETMMQDGMNVLIEGRAQTLNYVRTPHRFELVLSKPLTIGMRRAAQRIVGAATAALDGEEGASPRMLKLAMESVLVKLAQA